MANEGDFKFHKLDGVFYPTRKWRWEQFMEAMADDSYWSVKVREWSDKRSLLQNNAYWGPVMEPLCEFTGYEPYEMHEELLRVHAPREIYIDLEGEPRERIVRTSKMTVKQMTKYLDDIIRWAQKRFGIIIEIDPDLRSSGLNPSIPDDSQPQWTKS